MILLTAMPPSRNAGAVPTAPLVRLLAAELTRRGGEVRVLTPAAEAHDCFTQWANGFATRDVDQRHD